MLKELLGVTTAFVRIIFSLLQQEIEHSLVENNGQEGLSKDSIAALIGILVNLSSCDEGVRTLQNQMTNGIHVLKVLIGLFSFNTNNYVRGLILDIFCNLSTRMYRFHYHLQVLSNTYLTLYVIYKECWVLS